MSSSNGNFYGVIGQPLTPEYLAKQLPFFQHKVPKSIEGSLKFFTNAPSNLPLPPLYPGEEILLQEHRIVCVGTFTEPAVGAIFLTNFRVIFCGNLISDPESVDSLQSVSHQGKGNKDHLLAGADGASLSSKLKDKFTRNNERKSEPNFHSFIYPEQMDADNVKTDRTRNSHNRIKSLRRTIGSLRRPRKATSTLPPPPHPPPVLVLDRSQSTDPIKRRGVHCDPETNSLGSNSASSLSEFSSTTGTDERSLQSPLRETGTGASTPIDIELGAIGNGRLSPTLVTDSSYRKGLSVDTDYSPSAPDGKGILFSVTPTTDDSRPILRARSNETPRKKFSKAVSVEVPDRIVVQKKPLKKAVSVDQSNSLCPDRRSRKFWESSLVILESDSDSDSVDHVDPVVSASSTHEIDRRLDDEDSIKPDYAKIEILGPRSLSTPDQDSETSEKAPTYARLHTSLPDSTPPYANLEIALDKPSVVTNTRARRRSQSSSPMMPKKPKPLPRLMSGPRGDRSELISSLPGDFKPLSLPVAPIKEVCLSPPTEEHTTSDATGSSPEHQGLSQTYQGLSLTTLPQPERDSRSVSPMPVPPPRRKRKTKRGRLPAQKSPAPNRTEMSNQHETVVSVDDTSADVTGDKESVESGDANGRLDKVPGLDSAESAFDSLDHLLLRGTSDSAHYRVGSSHTSLIVGEGSSRPHSVMGSAYFQGNGDMGFVVESKGPNIFSSTLPRSTNMAVSWSPKSDLLRNKSIAAVPSLTRYTLSVEYPLYSVHSIAKLQPIFLKEQGIKLGDGLLILCRSAHSLKIHIHPHNTYDADGLRELLERQLIVPKPLHDLFAFQYYAGIHHPNPTFIGNRSLASFFKISGEVNRLGLVDSKLWRVSRILIDHPELCPSYPTHLIMPICTPDMDIMRGSSLYKEGRFPTLTWIHQSGAALLRGAATKDERGQGSSSQQMDEALLQAICACTCSSSVKGPSTLHVFTEKGTDKVLAEPKHSSLKPDEVRTYYYHNCKFYYSEAPPTFKSVRHSFNKLQAFFESKLPDEDYLLALDSTKWLQRVGEIMTVSNRVVRTLTELRAHVLVCFESGWDRTTQIVSLAQLLADPYYRTMTGFQILVQKEWVWFGHPFRTRHSQNAKTKAKNDGPIFLQWVDCVWQVLNQCPSAFEFNEKLLMSMVEETYSGKFGTFMTDCEKMRKKAFTEKGFEHMSVSTHTVSYWTWVAMINSVGRAFYNELYEPKLHHDVIVPSAAVPCLSLWTSYYCKHKNWERAHHSPAQNQLQDLVHTYKQLEALRMSLQPETSRSQDFAEGGTPPPLMPRDGILERSLKDTYTSVPMRPKPTPPPKPSTKQFTSISDYLTNQGLDPSLCQHVELSNTICQGNLLKIGALRKNWLKRWFVLDFSCQFLAYFENKLAYDSREVPKGVIRMSDISKVYQNVKKKDHLMRNIVTIETSQRTYLIQAPTIASMNIWQMSLNIPGDTFVHS